MRNPQKQFTEWDNLTQVAEEVDACEDAFRVAQYEFAKALDSAVEVYGQNTISNLVGVSSAFISDVRHGNRKAGRKLIAGIIYSKPPKEPTD